MLVATPSWLGDTEFCTTTVKPAIAGPMPRPRMSIHVHSSQSGTSAVMCVIKKPPMSITTAPAVMIHL